MSSHYSKLNCPQLESVLNSMNSPEELFATLLQADRQLRAQLDSAEQRAHDAEQDSQNVRHNLAQVTREVQALQDLCVAREKALYAKDHLIDQLKAENEAIRQSYVAALKRNGDDYKTLRKFAETGKSNNDRRISVTIGGNRQDMRFSDAELAHVFKENERLEAAGAELIRQVEAQKDAHAKLRDTVGELMQQLEENSKDREVSEKRTVNLEKKVTSLQKEISDKENLTAELQRKLNKVQAEWEAASMAHSYSSAEVRKLKMKMKSGKGQKSKPSRPSVGGSVLGGVENLLHRSR